MTNRDYPSRSFAGSIVFVICFLIGCLFLYWAVEYYVYNNFDHNRYTISKLQVGNNDSLSVWKLDNRTGELEYCTKSYDRLDHFVCVRSVNITGKDDAMAADASKLVPANKSNPSDLSHTETSQPAKPMESPGTFKPVYSDSNKKQ